MAKMQNGNAVQDEVKLYGWQEEVIRCINDHQSARESEQYLGIGEYTVNRALGVVMCLPRSSGHTYLANFIASRYPTLLIYGNMNHYRDVTSTFKLHPQTETVSMYEVFYSVYKPSKHQPTQEMMDMKKKFIGKKAVVVDNALSVPPDLRDLVYNSAQGAVVFLGH